MKRAFRSAGPVLGPILAVFLLCTSAAFAGGNAPPPPAFKGSFDAFNLNGNYGDCVPKVLDQFGDLKGFAKLYAAQEAVADLL